MSTTTTPTKLAAAMFGPNLDGTATDVVRFLAEAGYLWYYRGQFDQAVTVFKAVALLSPSSPVAQLGLAEVYLSQGKFREADKAAETAGRSDGADRRTMALAYTLRGRALVQLNRAKDAEKSLQRAAEVDPDGEQGKAANEILEAARKAGIFPASAAAPQGK